MPDFDARFQIGENATVRLNWNELRLLRLWRHRHGGIMKFTQYFTVMRQRPDRSEIKIEWISLVVENPIREFVQHDGRIRRWGTIPERDGKYLRVVLLPDGETVHNAFFDRGFTP